MIAFATLFLGLAVGMQPVEVVVGDEVATVEILLGGRSLGVLEGPPWKRNLDFGGELTPQILEAVAYDSERREIGRIRQLINLPHPRAELSVVVERQAGARAARLAWESMEGAEPKSISAWLDGEALEFEDPRRIPLNVAADERTHLFSAQLDFDNDVSSQVTLIFGGSHVDEVSTDLTAIPVYFEGDRRKPTPPPEAFRGWFVAGDGRTPLDVVAVERGSEDVIVVMPQNFDTRRNRLTAPRTAVSLDKDQAVRLVLPAAQQQPGVGTNFDLFPISPEYTRDDGGLFWLLTGLVFRGYGGRPHFGAAVAVAGLTAYERQRRRAVVLLLGSEVPVEGPITPDQSRRYLERLKVPLFIWTVDPRPGAPSVWGEPVGVASPKKLKAAFKEVSAVLDRQWIVWLDGTHLPQDIRLSSAAKGIALTP